MQLRRGFNFNVLVISLMNRWVCNVYITLYMSYRGGHKSRFTIV